MSTVTLSKPHCAITSAENPDGIASHALTTALPEAQTCFTLFAIIVSFPFVYVRRHCEEHLRRSNPACARVAGLLRGACPRARVRATQWLAITLRGSRESPSSPL